MILLTQIHFNKHVDLYFRDIRVDFTGNELPFAVHFIIYTDTEKVAPAVGSMKLNVCCHN